ncbi:MAG TPA: N-acetylmuramoyl-L-alanine amidase [Thermoanaerobaculia bacterium]|nr:N-acetylmuramoyl-L-alanine amidase [Thermoanaerobaculia bacterium]
MRKWWVWLFLNLAAIPLSAASSATQTPIALAQISPAMRAVLTREYEIEVTVTAHRGDAWTRLARRVTGDAAAWEEIAALNQADENLKNEQQVRVPFALLRPSLQRDIIATLFPLDRAKPDGWRHVVVGSRGVEGESLWKLAEWFTGHGANYSLIRKANPTQGLSTRKGDVILIPKRLLSAAFGGSSEEENAPKTAAEVRKPQDGPAQRISADEDVPEASADVVSTGPAALSYERGPAEPFAVYKLQKGEALYSSVAIRFTGRVYAKDVYDVLDRVVKFNEIEDVAKLPVGYAVKIPMDLLLPEWLPQDDPTRVAAEATRRASVQAKRRTRAAGLAGVHVILDAGHGGRDVGTEHDDVWESTYVYDVACRLKRILEKQSAAKVSMTTKSKSNGFRIPEKNVLEAPKDHFVQTTPTYLLDDAIVGVNLRWYLANSMFRRTMKSGVPREKVVFLSIHADSLHPSLRGAMAYIPGAGLVTGTYRKKGDIYLARAEVREQPAVTQSRDDALAAEGLSRDFAESVIASFRRTGLKVHPFAPVRDNVVRSGREWVPAVIRHNQVPTRMLLEVCNLGNRKDRQLLTTKKYRQQLAEAIYQGLVDFYETQETRPAVVASGAR